MKSTDAQKQPHASPSRSEQPFFAAKPEQAFFTKGKPLSKPFFGADAPVQAKLTVGAAGDQYEQEADRVAAAVVDQIHSPSPEPAGEQQAVQRMGEEEEELQAKPLQRMEEEDELQMKPLAKSIQRMGEEEDELQMKPLQREAMEEDELQMKPLVQRVGADGGEVSSDFESELTAARGGGQSLAPDLQAQMGQAMGADFSEVRVHTDGRADGLNRSVGARAFTTGQDLFFKRGEYQPGSRSGQKLIAHELAHVVQQNERDHSAIAKSRTQLSENKLHQLEKQSRRVRSRQTVEKGIQRRGENPHAKEGSYEGWDLTAHHIIAHTKLVEAYKKLGHEQQQSLLRKVIPVQLTASMMKNVKVKLDPEDKDKEKEELKNIRALLINPEFLGEIKGIKVQDIRESFFEWMGGNQYFGPNTSIRAEPSSSKDDIDTDGQFYTKANYDEMKKLGDALYKQLDLKDGADSDAIYSILIRIAAEAKDVKPHEFNPDEWVEVGTMEKLQQMAESKLLNRKHIFDYSFFKLNIPDSVGAFPTPYERLMVTNPGLSEFQYDGVLAAGKVGNQKVYFSLNTTRGVAKKTKARESLRSIFTDFQAKITPIQDGWEISTNDAYDNLVIPVPSNDGMRKIDGYDGAFNVSRWEKGGGVITDNPDSKELTKETSGESLYSYLLQTKSPVSSYLPKPLYEYATRKPTIIEAIKKAEIKEEALQKRLEGLQKQKSLKGVAKQQALVQKQIEEARKTAKDLKVALNRLETTVK